MLRTVLLSARGLRPWARKFWSDAGNRAAVVILAVTLVIAPSLIMVGLGLLFGWGKPEEHLATAIFVPLTITGLLGIMHPEVAKATAAFSSWRTRRQTMGQAELAKLKAEERAAKLAAREAVRAMKETAAQRRTRGLEAEFVAAADKLYSQYGMNTLAASVAASDLLETMRAGRHDE